MDTKVIVVLLIPILLIELSLKGVALWDIAHRERPRYLPRLGWVLIVLFVNLLGPVTYLLIGREE